MSQNFEVVTLGGGCFWCLEAIYQQLIGVQKVVSGYAGGHVDNPTYRQICGGQTGHAEVTQVTFDPDVMSYEDMLEVFWRIHDPTTLNRQGADVGPQYRSIIMYHNEEQREIAEQSVAQTDASDLYHNPIVTEVVPLSEFYAAEAYHQNYYRSNPYQGYCRLVIDPKVRKFRKDFQNKLA